MAARLAARGGSPLLIGPDEESAQWVSAIAAPAAETEEDRRDRLEKILFASQDEVKAPEADDGAMPLADDRGAGVPARPASRQGIHPRQQGWC